MLAANYPPPVLPIRGRGAVPGASVHRLSMENDLAQSVDDFSGDVLLGCPTSQLSMDWWPIFPLAALLLLLLLLLLPMCLSSVSLA